MIVAYYMKGQETKLFVPDEMEGQVRRMFAELLVAVAEHEAQAGKIAA